MSDSLRSRVGERIRSLRENRQLDQKKLAKKARTTQNTISSIERGATATNLDIIERIAQAMDVGISDILGADGYDLESYRVQTLRINQEWMDKMRNEREAQLKELARIPDRLLTLLTTMDEAQLGRLANYATSIISTAEESPSKTKKKVRDDK